MPKMFQIGNYLLRESTRQLDSDNNTAQITMTYEPKFNELVGYQRNSLIQKFFLLIDTDETWKAIKDSGADPLVDIIDAEVQRYRIEKNNFVDDGITPAPYPLIFYEVVEFLASQDYTIIDME